METTEQRSPVQPGEPAPDFMLPAVNREGVVSLADYRGKSPLLLTILRGLWCPFCRRHVAHLGITREKLQAAGVETLGVVATKPERARLYFRFRPARVPLAADPDLVTHRSYGVPKPVVTPELVQALESLKVNPTGELAEPTPFFEASSLLDKLDGFTPTEVDQEDLQRQYGQLCGQFLIDRDGVVRWSYIECAQEGLAGVGKYPTDEELLARAATMAS